MLDDSVRLKFMLGKLKAQVDNDCIDNDWACKFITDVYVRAKQGLPITQKQADKIEELFERY